MNKQRLRVSVCCPRSAVAQLVCLLFFWLTVPISRFLWPWSISVCCGAPAMSLSSSSHAAHRCRLYVHLFFYSLWHLPWASLLCVLSLLARFMIVRAHLRRLNFFWTAIDHVSLLIISLPAGIVATYKPRLDGVACFRILAPLSLQWRACIMDKLLYVMCGARLVTCFEHRNEFVPSGATYYC